MHGADQRVLGTQSAARAGEGDVDGIGDGCGGLELIRIATRFDGGFERVEAHTGFAACFGRSALQHFADAREKALLAANPADAQLFYGFDSGCGGGVLIELRQDFAEEAVQGSGRIIR